MAKKAIANKAEENISSSRKLCRNGTVHADTFFLTRYIHYNANLQNYNLIFLILSKSNLILSSVFIIFMVYVSRQCGFSAMQKLSS
jgi:hypothetical protein